MAKRQYNTKTKNEKMIKRTQKTYSPVPEWDKVWSQLSSHLQPFFWLIAQILTILDKKYRI